MTNDACPSVTFSGDDIITPVIDDKSEKTPTDKTPKSDSSDKDDEVIVIEDEVIVIDEEGNVDELDDDEVVVVDEDDTIIIVDQDDTVIIEDDTVTVIDEDEGDSWIIDIFDNAGKDGGGRDPIDDGGRDPIDDGRDGETEQAINWDTIDWGDFDFSWESNGWRRMLRSRRRLGSSSGSGKDTR